MRNLSTESRIALVALIVTSLSLIVALVAYFLPLAEIGPSPFARSSPTFSPTTQQSQYQTQTPVPLGSTREVDNVTIPFTGTGHISLALGELIVGTADRFRSETGEPPCTAFLIRGPYTEELPLYWAGWDKWINVYDDRFAEQLLAEKVDELKHHETCPSRGPIHVVRLP
ncbi:MAG: hypothetical protein QOH93_475 [Chloroflexia bacterium]|nr:hypothetical protein [Chloroflexia bacterium]